jgi:hypothetical protein
MNTHLALAAPSPRLAPLLWMLLLACLLRSGGSVSAQITPLPQAHAHNDYAHRRPLLDALDQGFCNVEADIWLVDGRLLVAHDRIAVRPERTLQALYLDPLRDRVRTNGGRVYPLGPPFTLLIDVKSAAEPAYAALREVLQGYAGLLTVFTPTNTVTNAVTVILSGNRATAVLAAESRRFAAIDGRLTDLGSNAPPHLIPLVSDNWRLHFQWRGQGPLPDAERVKLRQTVGRAHQQGRRLRFWATPDSPAVWRELQSAGVDLINTDDLPGLRQFLLRPAP